MLSPESTPGLIEDLNGNQMPDPGDTIRFRFGYRNEGNADATNAQVVADYDEVHVKEIAADSIGANGQDDGNAITWILGRVEPGAEATLAFNAVLQDKFPPGETLVANRISVNVAEMSAPTRAEQSLLLVAHPRLEIALPQGVPELIKDLDGNGQVGPGDTVRYRITYQNRGSADAANVVITSAFDPKFIASTEGISGNGDRTENTISWQVARLAPDEAGSATFDATLHSEFPPGNTTVGITAQITSDERAVADANHSFAVASTAPVEIKVEAETAPAGGPFAEVPWVPILFIGLLAAAAMGILTYVGAIAKYSDGEEQSDLGRHRVRLVREGVFLIFIISAILILALSDDLAADGAVSILSAIVGYVFGRSSSSV